MTDKTTNTPAVTKLPALNDLRRMAKEVGGPTAETDALIPPKTKPTNKQKQLIEEHRAKAPKGAASKATTRRKPTSKPPKARSTRR
ncbi:MAG: hypothetical protein ACI9MR_002400 [Myxococcota bacterium]|jgi:hypothetical protein